jgi:hypothetical protein
MNDSDIIKTYDILIDIMLQSEGAFDNYCVKSKAKNWHYTQNKQLRVPACLLPLIYAASNCLQMSVAFLPYYLKNNPSECNFKAKITQNPLWYSGVIYPKILKFFLLDSLRIQPSEKIKHDKDTANIPKNIYSNQLIFYDSSCTLHPPYGGINVHHIDTKALDIKHKTLYLVGDITVQGIDILKAHTQSNIIWGITPEKQNGTPHEAILKRINYFSQTILSGSMNLQVPLINHALQTGLSPISFYQLLYRSNKAAIIIQNALCLLNNKPLALPIDNQVHYQRCPSHIDLETPCNTIKYTQNYLYLLSGKA